MIIFDTKVIVDSVVKFAATFKAARHVDELPRFLQSSFKTFGFLNRSGGDLGPDCN